MNRWWPVLFAPALVCLALGPPAGGSDEKKEAAKKPKAGEGAAAKRVESGKGDAGKKPVLTGPLVFPMEEVSAFGKDASAGDENIVRFPRGQYAGCGNVPDPQVRAYPKFHSKQPLYGKVTFDADYYGRRPGITYHFALDESGEAEKKPEGGEKKSETKEKKSMLLEALAKSLEDSLSPQSGREVPKCHYDRMYFDRNGDLDLTNDGVIKLAEKSPLANVPVANSAVFDNLTLTFDYGPPLGKRPFVVVPWVMVFEGGGYAQVQFVPTVVRKGTIRFGGQEYMVWLRQANVVSGRFDRPEVLLDLTPKDRSKGPLLLESGPLGQMQVVDGQFLTLSASPLGDKLTIAPYAGDVGVLEIGAGGRAITQFGATGVLYGAGITVPLGDPNALAPEKLPRRYTLPVGDYIIPSLTAQYGRLRFNARMIPNRGPSEGGAGSSSAHPIKIRKDKPYVLEFSGKPDVQFIGPDKGHVFKRGDNIYIGAMLNEPWQGIQITGLWDTTDKKGEQKYYLKGKLVSAPDYSRLDPTIVIKSSKGETVADGKMPFG